MSDNEELLVAFRALAVISQQLVAEGAGASEALEALEPREKAALRQFRTAGEHCLGQLKGWTLQALEDVGTALKYKSIQRRASSDSHKDIVGKLGKTGQNIYDMFQKYDKDGNGTLESEEFRHAFLEITNSAIDSNTLKKLQEAWDVNSDGVIDIHEFVVWLYGNDAGGGNDVEVLKAKLKEAEVELKTKRRLVNQLESQHEEEMEATHDFWRSVAKNAVLNIDQKVDIDNAEWLGNGKYGFVLKATRRRDNRQLVVKMMGVRWAHLAAQEWKSGTLVGKHNNVVEYEDVMLHADDDKSIQNLLKCGYESGALKSRAKRSTFPDRYICLTQELMNRGTVQDWIDNDLLLPGGEFVIMQQVACALAYMHRNGVTHNDIKPENIMLHEDAGDRTPKVKLGDLGLATTSKEIAEKKLDFWQYGMTTFCMIGGEKFGSRKYRDEDAPSICNELVNITKESGSVGKVLKTYEDVPRLLQKIFPAQIGFEEVRDWPSLQGWGFYEGGNVVNQVSDSNAIARATHRKDTYEKTSKLSRINTKRLCAALS